MFKVLEKMNAAKKLVFKEYTSKHFIGKTDGLLTYKHFCCV